MHRARALIFASLLLTTGAPAQARAAELTLVSLPGLLSEGAADGHSNDPSVSADGRYVAFSSTADNLSALDDNDRLNVFVRDTSTSRTTLVSRRTNAEGGAGADGNSFEPAISGDGRFVVFTSEADNLSATDDNLLRHVFIRDLVLGTTTHVAHDAADPVVSANGRFVAFSSLADSLSPDDDNSVRNVFVRDVQTGAATLVSRRSAAHGGAGADGASARPAISADGRYVAFDSTAANLSSPPSARIANVYVRDLQAGTTTLASRQAAAHGGAGANGRSLDASISDDGRFVAFNSVADNLDPGPAVPGDSIFLRDVQAQTTTQVDRQSATDGGAVADAPSYRPVVSAGGRYVAFLSDAENLSAASRSATTNVFVRDTQAGTTTLVSRQAAPDGGEGAAGNSSAAAMSPSGRHVAFASFAENLSPYDGAGTYDVFLREMPAPPAAAPVVPASPEPPAIAPPLAAPPPSPPSGAAPPPPARRSTPSVAQVLTLRSARRCRRGGTLVLSLRRTDGAPVERVTITVRAPGSKVTRRVVTGRALRSPIRLRRLPRGRFSVAVAIRLADGTTLTAARTYRTC